jgi:hypothetical protein
MKEQNISNHRRIMPAFHFGVLGGLLIYEVFACRVLIKHYQLGWGLTVPALLILAGFFMIVIAFMARGFALRAQDRAIRAEENLRYFAITGNLLDSRLTIGQVIALRFAPNNELLDLAHKAAEQSLSPKQIKQEIKHWKGDYHRV